MKRIVLALLFFSVPAFAKTTAVGGIALDSTSADRRHPQTISTPAGETGAIGFGVTHAVGTLYDLTGAQALLTVRKSDGTIVISRQATITDAPNGIGIFPLVVADTVSLLGTYSYDVWLTASDGSRYQIVPASSFVVTAGIGQPGQAVTVPAAQQPLAQGPAGPQGNPQFIQVGGVTQASEPIVNYSSGVSCVDDPGNTRLNCSLTGAGSGSVTSVAMSMPAQFSVSGSPVTTSGTLAASWANESANTVMCGPSTGPAAAPTFRALVAADIPALPESQITSLTSDLASKAPTTRTITAGTGLTGGGDFSADRTLAIASTVPICTPTTAGDYCASDGAGGWVREPAPSVGGGTQAGTTSASHVPYASGANTLSDTELSFNSVTHTLSVIAATIIDFSATASLVKFGAGISSASGDLPFAFGGNATPHFTMSDLGGLYALYFGPKTTGDYIFAGSNQFVFRTAGNTVLGVNTASVSPGSDSSSTSGQAGLRWKAIMAGAAIGAQPTCDSTTRGATMTVFANAGASDTFQVCMKAAANTYAWRTVFTAP